jgi:geranylgeranyl diphosphate synthase type II
VTNSEKLKRDKEIVEHALKKYLGKLKGPAGLKRAMHYACFSGGKRLRPILAIESSRALKGNIKKALPLACAIEFVHNFSLIHDDLPAMDNDDTRRGKPACHRKFDEGLAILAGDALLNLAFGVLSNLRQKNTMEIISLFSEAIGTENMIGGQALDLDYEKGLKKNKLPGNKINRMKTAALMALPCKAGALAAGAAPKYVKKMHEFGINLGLAFQVADNIKDSRKSRPASGRMKKEVKSFIAKAKKYIASFGKSADTLRYIADEVYGKIA